MVTAPRPSPLLRIRGSADDGKVRFVELLFDLIFVFSIIQLSHTLAHHYTPLGVLETGMLVLAVWWVWVYSAWVMNWLDPDRPAVRGLVFALMFLGLLMSASIPAAFADRGLAFAGAYVAMQVGRSLFMLAAVWREHGRNYRNFLRITAWLVAAGALWLAGGLAGPELRLGLWLAALAVEVAGPAAGFWLPGLGRSTAADWDISGAHMAERCALFVIICIGETVLVTGRTFAEAAFTATSLAAFAVAFLMTVSIWWVYFQFGHHRAAHLIEHAAAPGALGRAAYTYAHIGIVAGIILSAVGAEFLLAHPLDPASWATATAVLGGPAVFLAGNIWFKGLTARFKPLSHLVGLGLLAAVALATPWLTLLTQGLCAAAVLIVVAAWEWVSLHPREPASPA